MDRILIDQEYVQRRRNERIADEAHRRAIEDLHLPDPSNLTIHSLGMLMK